MPELILLCLISGPGARGPGTSPIDQNPPKLFKLVNPKFITLSFLAFPTEILVTGVPSYSYPLPANLPGVFHVAPHCILLSLGH